MSLLDRFVVSSIPFIPKAVVHRVARRYVAGETLEDAVGTVRSLAAEGAMSTLDVLGESVTHAGQTEAARDEYLRVLDAIAASGLPANTSIKPTALGLSIDLELARRNLTAICARAAEKGIFVRLRHGGQPAHREDDPPRARSQVGVRERRHRPAGLPPSQPRRPGPPHRGQDEP